MRVEPRGAALTAVAAVLALVVSGCGAGQDSLTSRTLPSIPGVDTEASDGSVSVRNALIVYRAGGYPAQGEALVEAVLVNETDQPVRLIQATAEGATALTAVGDTVIPAGGVLQLQLRATGLTAPVTATTIMPVTFTFSNGAQASMRLTMAPPLSPEPRQPMDLGGEH